MVIHPKMVPAIRPTTTPIQRGDSGSLQSHLTGIGLEELLQQHAHRTSALAEQAAQLEETWLRFANATEGGFLPTALPIIERLDRLRSGQVEEIRRAAALLHEISQPPSRVNLVVRDSGQALILAPSAPRKPEED